MINFKLLPGEEAVYAAWISDLYEKHGVLFATSDAGVEKNIEPMAALLLAARNSGGTANNRLTLESLYKVFRVLGGTLEYEPGYEPHGVKEALAAKAQGVKDREEVEKRRRLQIKDLAGDLRPKMEFDRIDEARAAAVAKNPKNVTGVNAPSFIEKNAKARAEFDDLVQRGSITYRFNREDRAKTQERREILRRIRVVAQMKDAKGNEVPIYSAMIEKAKELIARWETADSRG